STGIMWTSPAEFDRGSITFTMSAHNTQHDRFTRSATLLVTGNDLSDQHPPVPLAVNGRAVDLAIVDADSAARPAPAILYVPPTGTPARTMLRWAFPYPLRGFTVGLVSLPGTGRSIGTPDQAGPASVTAIGAAIDRLARQPGVDPKRIIVWGEGEGATTAL